MNAPNTRSTELLNKVYDELDKVDLSKLSMRELSDFLEVVQKGRFLETAGQMPPYGLAGLCAAPFNNSTKPADSGADKQE